MGYSPIDRSPIDRKPKRPKTQTTEIPIDRKPNRPKSNRPKIRFTRYSRWDPSPSPHVTPPDHIWQVRISFLLDENRGIYRAGMFATRYAEIATSAQVRRMALCPHGHAWHCAAIKGHSWSLAVIRGDAARPLCWEAGRSGGRCSSSFGRPCTRSGGSSSSSNKRRDRRWCG